MKNAYAWLLVIVAIFVGFLSAPLAQADTITFTGKLSSDSTAVGVGDPVITNPSTIHTGDPFSILLTYDPTMFTHPTASSYVLTSASLTLSFDGYAFLYTTGGGNYIQFSTPGVYGAGTVSFKICSAQANCSTTDFINLYFSGNVTSLSTLASQAGGLTGYTLASPSQFEFLRNFANGNQTDLQGTLGTPAGTVPEPGTLALLTLGAAFVGIRRRVGRAGEQREG